MSRTSSEARRGEIWTIAGAGLASEPRPALIVQDDQYALDSLTVIMLTSVLVEAPLYRVRVPATEASGLTRDNDVVIDKIMTVRLSNVRDRVGLVVPETMTEVERLLLVFLGIA